MKPIDYRNTTWEALQETLTGRRLQVLDAWRIHGPGTTREVAARAGIDILTLRPRTTELLDLGLLDLVQVDETRTCRQAEGVYRARTADEARRIWEWRRLQTHQAELDLRATT